MLKCRTCGGQTILVERWNQENLCSRSLEYVLVCPNCPVTRRSEAHVSGDSGKGDVRPARGQRGRFLASRRTGSRRVRATMSGHEAR